MTVQSKRNLIFGFGLSLIILMFTFATSYVVTSDLLDSQKWVSHTSEVISKLETIISRMKDAETAQRGFLLTGQPEFLEPYKDSREDVMANFQSAQELTADNHLQQMVFPWLRGLIDAKYTIIDTAIGLKRQGGAVSIPDLRTGKLYMDKTRGLIKLMILREENLMKARVQREQSFAKYAPIAVIVACLVSLLISVVFYRRIQVDFQERIRLQAELEQKETDLNRRISVVEGLAKKIADGDYGVRIQESDLE